MLQITIPEWEYYDEKEEVFVEVKKQTLQLEHSLVSVSKWESRWHKPYLKKEEKTYEESIDYIRCMTITKNVDPKCYYGITNKVMKQIDDYVNDSMTATWFNEQGNKRKNNKVITSELIYSWMITLDIPIECERWHLNRLFVLIRICDIQNSPKKKMSNRDKLMQQHKLNEARKRKYGTRG